MPARRRRPPVSCTLCRKRKVRCNREAPCNNCVRSKSKNCIYDSQALQPVRPRHGLALEPRESSASLSERANNDTGIAPKAFTPRPSAAHSSDPVNLGSQSSVCDAESMLSRIRELEQKLSKATNESPQKLAPGLGNETQDMPYRPSRTNLLHHESEVFGLVQDTGHGVIHKTQLFGRSHWINGAMLVCDTFNLIEPYLLSETSKAFAGMRKCKSLGRTIKAQRQPLWPCPPTTDLPPKDVADKLIECYFRTSETIYRVLHIPTWKRDYEAIWLPGAEPEISFLVQVKLVFAIGATTYDRNFSLRASAVRWVYEAYTWLSEPELKSKLSFQLLQTNILLLLARQTTNIEGKLIWISVGTLLRVGLCMGLHKDFAHLSKRKVFVTEMRRRLWNTILEMLLQASMDSGQPPLISLNDFDTEPPGNLDDEQLMHDNPTKQPENNFTSMSIPIALRETFPLRLAIAKFLNDISTQGTYEETLRFDASVRKSHKAIRQILEKGWATATSSRRQFEASFVDILMWRYLSALHVPFYGQSLDQAAYAFSRKVVIETALRTFRAICPSPSITSTSSHGDTISSSDDNDMARFAICGSSFIGILATQACFLISLELRAQLEEDGCIGPVTPRPDLLAVTEDARSWALQTFEAGETNVKGYVVFCVMAAQIDALVQGLEKEKIPTKLVQAMEEAEETCISIFERIVAQRQTENGSQNRQKCLADLTPASTEEWDFMQMSGFEFDDGDSNGNTDFMSWMFADSNLQDPSFW